MVDKAQKQASQEKAADKNDLLTERQEIAAIAQLQLLSHSKNPRVVGPLQSQFGEVVEGLRDEQQNQSDGASMAPRSVDDKEADPSSADGVLTGAAFDSGLVRGQVDSSAAVGQSVGSATQVFSNGGSGKGKGRIEAGSSEDTEAAMVSRTSQTLDKSGDLFQRVDKAFAISFERSGGGLTVRQETAADTVRKEALKYPGLQQLTALPESMKVPREAFNWIMCAATTYMTVAVEACNQKNGGRAQHAEEPVLSVPPAGAKRFVPSACDIDIDPAKLLAYVPEESDPIVAA